MDFLARWFTQPQAIARPSSSTKNKGDAAEQLALLHLQAQGLKLVQRQFKTPGRGGGEIDLVMRDADGTLVFVEVRARKDASAGGAAASVSAVKQRRIVFAAQHYLQRHHSNSPPPCRFDVVAIESEHVSWIKAAFPAE
jgi:putative endonuclease